MFDAPLLPLPSRVVLAEVSALPPMRRGACAPGYTPFVKALAHVDQFLEGGARASVTDVHPTYTRLMGVTGAAFRVLWGKDWDAGANNVRHLSDDGHAPLRRAGDAVGRGMRYLSAGGDPDRMRATVRATLAQGRPVITFGVASPGEAELIAGYADDGQMLLGWSAFQDEPALQVDLVRESNGMFGRADWTRVVEGVLLVGEEADAPAPRALARTAFRVASEVLYTRRTHHRGVARWCGLVAWSAWAEQVVSDPSMTAMSLWEWGRAYRAHQAAVLAVREARTEAAQFLAATAPWVDDVLSLRQAIQHARAVVELLTEVECLAPEVEAFCRPRVRDQLAMLLSDALRHDTRVAQLLGSMGVSPLG